MISLETHFFEFATTGHTQVIKITDEVQQVLNSSGFTEGNVTLFATGTTTGISTLDLEPGLAGEDLQEMFESFVPYAWNYQHNKNTGDENGSSHLRSFLTGNSLALPFKDGKLILGFKQQIVFVDFDTQARRRKFVAQFMGLK